MTLLAGTTGRRNVEDDDEIYDEIHDEKFDTARAKRRMTRAVKRAAMPDRILTDVQQTHRRKRGILYDAPNRALDRALEHVF